MITHLVFEGVSDGAIGVAVDVVSTAARLAPTRGLRQRVVSVDGAPVRTGAGRTLTVDGALSARAAGPGEVFVLPGISAAATPAAVETLLRRADVVRAAQLLPRAAERRGLVAASCSATFVLGSSGLLDGKEATTTWWLAPTFARRFPKVTLRADRMVVEDRRLITAGAALAHADLMLAIVARTIGPSLAHLVASYLVLEQRSSQARYMVLDQVRTADPTVRAIERAVLASLERQLSVHDMARAASTSPRTLARRIHAALGTTPQRFAQRLRVIRAVHLLETTDASVEEIASTVGYADAAAFRRVFRRETGEAPRERRMRAAGHTRVATR